LRTRGQLARVLMRTGGCAAMTRRGALPGRPPGSYGFEGGGVAGFVVPGAGAGFADSTGAGGGVGVAGAAAGGVAGDCEVPGAGVEPVPGVVPVAGGVAVAPGVVAGVVAAGAPGVAVGFAGAAGAAGRGGAFVPETTDPVPRCPRIPSASEPTMNSVPSTVVAFDNTVAP